MSNIHLSPNGENLTIEQTVLYNNIINEGYVYPIAEMRVAFKHYDKLASELKDYNYVVHDFTSPDNSYELWKCDEFRMDVVVDKDTIYVTTFTKSLESSSTIFKILSSLEPKTSECEVYMDSYYMQNNVVDSSFRSFSLKDYEHSSKDYYPYLDTNIMFDQLYTHKENILILCGEPGTGKTSLSTQLLKYSLLNPEKIPYLKDSYDGEYVHCAYVKSNTVLTDDGFWRTLSSKNYDLVILDDLDYFLTSRDQEIQTQEDAERNKFLSQFLSFTDGIEQNKTNFIITTNQPFEGIDAALLRKGRLFDILELRKLTNDEAKTIWSKAGLADKDFKYTGDVLQADIGSEISKRLNKKVKIQDYLFDKSVSKLNKNTKKLGF